MRSQTFPDTVETCASPTSPSGLAPVGGGACNGSGRFLLATTTSGPREITSNGLTFQEEASQTAFIRQLYAEVDAGPAGAFHARLGRQRLRIADGFVYDDWGLGLDLDLDVGAFGPPFAFSASVFYPSRSWPTGSDWRYPAVAMTAEWTPSLGEWVGVWGAWSSDRTGDAAAILQQGLVEGQVVELEATAPGSVAYRAASRRLAVLLNTPGSGTTSLGWPGVSGRLELSSRSEVRFTAGAAFGTVGATSACGGTAAAVEVPALGWLLSARLTVQPGSGFTVSPFFIWLTGDSPPSSQQIASGAGDLGRVPRHLPVHHRHEPLLPGRHRRVLRRPARHRLGRERPGRGRARRAGGLDAGARLRRHAQGGLALGRPAERLRRLVLRPGGGPEPLLVPPGAGSRCWPRPTSSPWATSSPARGWPASSSWA